jgi:type II secretory pathway component PulF
MAILTPNFSLGTLVPLCRQLAAASKGDIPIIQALALVRRESRKRRLNDVLEAMEERIREGDTLTDAMRAQSRYFPRYMIEVAAAGELTGRLDVAFADLAEFFEDRQTMRRRVIEAVAYPLIVLALAWFIGTFAIGMIQDVVAPAWTGVGATLSEYMGDYVLFQVFSLLMFAVVAVLLILLMRQQLVRDGVSAVAAYLWPVAPIVRRLALARFFRTMSLLIGAGLPMAQCIERSAAVTSNTVIERDMKRAAPRVKEGMTLSDSFAGSRYMTPTAREMMAVGETSGELEGSLRKVSEYYTDEALHAVRVGSRALYVFFYLAVACVVAYIIISFYTSYFGGMLDAIQ